MCQQGNPREVSLIDCISPHTASLPMLRPTRQLTCTV